MTSDSGSPAPPTDVSGGEPSSPTPTPPQTKRPIWQQLLPWLITLACFLYLYGKIAGAASRDELTVYAYLAQIFAKVDWIKWLALMVPYSFFFFLIDTLVVWRVVSWFNTRVSYTDMLPIRGSSYILSIINEQVGKGAMALYLNRKEGVRLRPAQLLHLLQRRDRAAVSA
jgi:hypothetical protein